MEVSSESEKPVAEGAVSVREAVRFTGLSRSELYARMERGELPYIKLGRRRLLPHKAVVAMLAAAVVGANSRAVAVA